MKLYKIDMLEQKLDQFGHGTLYKHLFKCGHEVWVNAYISKAAEYEYYIYWNMCPDCKEFKVRR